MKLKLNPIHGTFDYVVGPEDIYPKLVTAHLQNGAGQVLQVYDPYLAAHIDLQEFFIVTDEDGEVVWSTL